MGCSGMPRAARAVLVLVIVGSGGGDLGGVRGVDGGDSESSPAQGDEHALGDLASLPAGEVLGLTNTGGQALLCSGEGLLPLRRRGVELCYLVGEGGDAGDAGFPVSGGLGQGPLSLLQCRIGGLTALVGC